MSVLQVASQETYGTLGALVQSQIGLRELGFITNWHVAVDLDFPCQKMFHPLPPNLGPGLLLGAVNRATSFVKDDLWYGIFAGVNPGPFLFPNLSSYGSTTSPIFLQISIPTQSSQSPFDDVSPPLIVVMQTIPTSGYSWLDFLCPLSCSDGALPWRCYTSLAYHDRAKNQCQFGPSLHQDILVCFHCVIYDTVMVMLYHSSLSRSC